MAKKNSIYDYAIFEAMRDHYKTHSPFVAGSIRLNHCVRCPLCSGEYNALGEVRSVLAECPGCHGEERQAALLSATIDKILKEVGDPEELRQLLQYVNDIVTVAFIRDRIDVLEGRYE